MTYAKAIYASRDYLDAHWSARGEEGEGLCWIGWGDVQALPDWVCLSPFPKAEIRHTAREGMLVAELVGEGMGMSYLPCFSKHFDKRLVQVPGTEASLDRSVWLLLHPDLRHTTRVRLLIEHLSKEIKALRPVFMGPLA